MVSKAPIDVILTVVLLVSIAPKDAVHHAKHISHRHFLSIQFVDELPESITYSLDSSSNSGARSNLKIDILAPTMSFIEVPSLTDRQLRAAIQSSKCSKDMTCLDELNIISHEIERQINKKTTEILDLLKNYLSGLLEKNIFMERMADASDTTLSDLIAISKKLVKRHKFLYNPNVKDFMRIKLLIFPTTSKDLGEMMMMTCVK